MSTAAAPEASVSSVAGESRQLVVFALAGDEYGVPIGSVQEIIRYQPPRPVPGGPAHIEGMTNLRGSIIPVVDLHALIGSGTAHDDDAQILVAEIGDATVGIIVDEVREVLTLGLDRFQPPPPNSGAGEAVEAVAKVDDRLLVILDLPALCP